MTLVRWDQLREFEGMNERLIRAYGRQAPGRPAEGGKEALTVPDWAPAVDIAETPEEFLIKAELPEGRCANLDAPGLFGQPDSAGGQNRVL